MWWFLQYVTEQFPDLIMWLLASAALILWKKLRGPFSQSVFSPLSKLSDLWQISCSPLFEEDIPDCLHALVWHSLILSFLSLECSGKACSALTHPDRQGAMIQLDGTVLRCSLFIRWESYSIFIKFNRQNVNAVACSALAFHKWSVWVTHTPSNQLWGQSNDGVCKIYRFPQLISLALRPFCANQWAQICSDVQSQSVLGLIIANDRSTKD